MTTPVIDTVAAAQTVTSQPTAQQPAARVRDEAGAADLLTFQIGMGAVAVVLLMMTLVGAFIGSAPLVLAAGLFTVLLAVVNAVTDVTLVAR